MKHLNIANDKKRDALVGMEGRPAKRRITQSLPDGSPHDNIRVLKATMSQDVSVLLKRLGSPEELGKALIESDPEVDIETAGMLLPGTKKVWLTPGGEVAYRIKLQEVVKNPDGSERERRNPNQSEANITGDIPLSWSGKAMPKAQAIRRFAFTRHFQLRHLNGLTYDFLYAMAAELHKAGELMFIGGGKKGNEPLIFSLGGKPYRGFLEGRIDGDKYALILHLTNVELKEFIVKTEVGGAA